MRELSDVELEGVVGGLEVVVPLVVGVIGAVVNWFLNRNKRRA